MKIGELAKLARCTTETVRFYEKEGLMPDADRTVANYRDYSAAHLDRLRFIRNCRALDMAHDEIRALLGLTDAPTGPCGGINLLVDEHISHVDHRIAELMELRAQLIDLRSRCEAEQAVGDCGIVRELSNMDVMPSRMKHSHVG
ncbi:Cd(II)/Pb(II)-responsive transcriptional regulator [Caballeronia sp. DA-9]|uniref:Cd(II)/Pb(II)-responsive transcriptional regulator n=1 Tax=Caballeronia sp. DA-9 TaxID=3436237 RepID=UPI003F680D69